MHIYGLYNEYQRGYSGVHEVSEAGRESVLIISQRSARRELLAFGVLRQFHYTTQDLSSPVLVL